MLDIVPILSYNYSIALLVTTAKKTQVITGPAPEKAGRISLPGYTDNRPDPWSILPMRKVQQTDGLGIGKRQAGASVKR